jgi:hypothetical protein
MVHSAKLTWLSGRKKIKELEAIRKPRLLDNEVTNFFGGGILLIIFSTVCRHSSITSLVLEN